MKFSMGGLSARLAAVVTRALATVRWPDATLGKLGPGLIALLAGTLIGDLGLGDLARIVTLLTAFAAFGYTLNDWCDRREDALVGRPSVVGRLPAPAAWTLISVPLLVIAAVCRSYADRPAVLALVGGHLLASLAYSSPPLRLKARGGWGLLAILAAQYVVPGALLMACLRSAETVDWGFCLAFALVDGLCLELGHQLADRDADAATGLDTLAVRWPEASVRSAYSVALAVLGALIVACPFYLCLRLAGAVGPAGLWLMAWTPLLAVTIRLALQARNEWLGHPNADPYYGRSGPALRRLYSYFPNCVLPAWLAVLIVCHDGDRWPLLLATVVWLRCLALGRGTFTTGPPHYGFRWHLREAAAMVWPWASPR